MRCFVCTNKLPTNSYAVVDGIHYCLKCFLEQYNSLPNAPIPCQICGITSLSSNRKTSEQNQSTTSLNSTQSNKISNAAKRVGTSIANKFRQLQFSSPVPTANNQKPPRPPKSGQQTCQVCFEEKSSKHFHPIINHTCQQSQRTICDHCIYQHIKQSFQEMCTDDVRCPELQCGTKYNYEAIKHILKLNKDKEIFDRYDRFLMLHQLEQSDEFIWCSNPKCQRGQLNIGGGLNNIVRCTYCHKKTCFIHKIGWHQGLTCQEYDSITNSDTKASLIWLNQNTKTCPNCPYQIEKNDGCDHMTCIKCHYEFCWSCLADYNRIRRDGNHRHHPDCKHYAPYNK